jgi:hypothetical protein
MFLKNQISKIDPYSVAIICGEVTAIQKLKTDTICLNANSQMVLSACNLDIYPSDEVMQAVTNLERNTDENIQSFRDRLRTMWCRSIWSTSCECIVDHVFDGGSYLELTFGRFCSHASKTNILILISEIEGISFIYEDEYHKYSPDVTYDIFTYYNGGQRLWEMEVIDIDDGGVFKRDFLDLIMRYCERMDFFSLLRIREVHRQIAILRFLNFRLLIKSHKKDMVANELDWKQLNDALDDLYYSLR